MLILVYHAGIWAGFTWGVDRDHHGLGGFLRHGDLAVPVFFMISAFLLHRPFARALLRSEPGPAVRPYLLRRFARIVPAYWVALILSLVIVGRATELDAATWTRLLLLVQIYWDDTATAGLAQAWSLNTELAFYVLLPVLAAVIARTGRGQDRRRRTLYLLCLMLGLGGLAFRLIVFVDGPHRTGFWLPANLDLFAIGMAMAVTAADDTERGGDGRRPGRLLRLFADHPAAAVFTAALALVLLVAADLPLQTPPGVGDEFVERIGFAVIGTALLTPAAFGSPGGGLYRRVLGSRPLTFVGQASLGIYVWHVTVLDRLDHQFRPAGTGVFWREGGLFLVVAGSVLSILLGTLSWRTVERPILQRVRRIG